MKEEPSASISSQQEIQQSLMYLEQMKEQISTLQEQYEILDLAAKEHNSALETLDDFKNLNEKNEMLIPIGADSMVFAKILDPSKVIINIGAGISIEQNVDEAKETLSSRVKKIEDNLNKIKENINGLQEQVITLSSTIEEKYKHLQNNQEGEDKLGPLNVS